MTDAAADRTPLDQALDVLVYAPIGLILDGHAVMRDLAARGRNHAVGARMVGQFALAQGQRELERLTGRLADQVGSLLGAWGGAAPDGDHPTAATTDPSEPRPTTRRGDTVPAAPAGAPGAPAAPPVDTLAIHDYDGLSASQVVNRLPGLDPAELRAVRDYEATHRARKTILTKIARLERP